MSPVRFEKTGNLAPGIRWEANVKTLSVSSTVTSTTTFPVLDAILLDEDIVAVGAELCSDNVFEHCARCNGWKEKYTIEICY